MRKLIISLLMIVVITVVFLLVLFKYSDFFLFSSSQKISQMLVAQKNYNMELLRLDFDDAKFYSIDSIGWKKVSVRISVNNKKELFSGKDIFVNADNLKNLLAW